MDLCGLLQVKYKEKYEKEKGKPMLDFETPVYVTAKEAQHMQSQVNATCVVLVFEVASLQTLPEQPSTGSCPSCC